ncbi:MAG: hypothetical protein KIT68_07745, partial [Phycisphaeraceae bacterium]|nr:hypothetical protein [Phycisphaeraceae bacterium]
MGALWGGRFAGRSSDLFKRFNDSLPFDRALWREDLAGSAAWASALRRARVLTATEHGKIMRALGAIGRELERRPELLARSGEEDIHSYVERALIARVG